MIVEKVFTEEEIDLLNSKKGLRSLFRDEKLNVKKLKAAKK